MEQQRIEVVGKLGSTYGIRGWLRIYSELENWRHHNHEIIVKLKGVDDREVAQILANVEIGVDLSVFPELEEGDYYWHDLIGCSVVNLEGYTMGTVTEMMETGSNDVLVVKANTKDAFGKQERLIPFLYEQVVKRVDLTTKTIEVDWDAGF